jgi:hypothetical protein
MGANESHVKNTSPTTGGSTGAGGAAATVTGTTRRSHRHDPSSNGSIRRREQSSVKHGRRRRNKQRRRSHSTMSHTAAPSPAAGPGGVRKGIITAVTISGTSGDITSAPMPPTDQSRRRHRKKRSSHRPHGQATVTVKATRCDNNTLCDGDDAVADLVAQMQNQETRRVHSRHTSSQSATTTHYQPQSTKPAHMSNPNARQQRLRQRACQEASRQELCLETSSDALCLPNAVAGTTRPRISPKARAAGAAIMGGSMATSSITHNATENSTHQKESSKPLVPSVLLQYGQQKQKSPTNSSSASATASAMSYAEVLLASTPAIANVMPEPGDAANSSANENNTAKFKIDRDVVKKRRRQKLLEQAKNKNASSGNSSSSSSRGGDRRSLDAEAALLGVQTRSRPGEVQGTSVSKTVSMFPQLSPRQHTEEPLPIKGHSPHPDLWTQDWSDEDLAASDETTATVDATAATATRFTAKPPQPVPPTSNSSIGFPSLPSIGPGRMTAATNARSRRFKPTTTTTATATSSSSPSPPLPASASASVSASNPTEESCGVDDILASDVNNKMMQKIMHGSHSDEFMRDDLFDDLLGSDRYT